MYSSHVIVMQSRRWLFTEKDIHQHIIVLLSHKHSVICKLTIRGLVLSEATF